MAISAVNWRASNWRAINFLLRNCRRVQLSVRAMVTARSCLRATVVRAVVARADVTEPNYLLSGGTYQARSWDRHSLGWDRALAPRWCVWAPHTPQTPLELDLLLPQSTTSSNSSQSYEASPAVWDHTQCYLPPDTGKRASP